MKREILCLNCATSNQIERMKELALRYSEGFKHVEGKCLNEFFCDKCGKVIAKGQHCSSQSLWQGGRYYEWENEYIEIKQ